MRLTWTCLFPLVALGCTVGSSDDGNVMNSPVDAGQEGSKDAADDTDRTDSSSTDAPSDSVFPEVPAVEGTWARKLVYAQVNDIPAVGQTTGSTDTLLRVTIKREGTSLSMVSEPCAILIDNGTPVVKTLIPDKFLKSLGPQQNSGSLAFEDGIWKYRQQRLLTLRGVKLTDPEAEALPTSGSDPRVWDQDSDDKPGVTVRITGLLDGDVYVVQRDAYALDGSITSDSTLDGLTDWASEQVVLGSDNPILNMQTKSVRSPNPTASWFRSTRIDPSMTCPAIVAQASTLFAR